VVMALSSDLKGKSTRAGLALGLAGGVKLIPLAVVAWLVGRSSWKTLAWTGVALIALFGVTAMTPMGAPGLWDAYWDHGVVAKIGDDLSQPDNQSILGSLSRLPIERGVSRALWYASCGLVVSLVALASWRSRRSTGMDAISSAALCPAMILLISPGSWMVHYVMAMLPLAVLMAIGYGFRDWAGIAAFWAGNLAFTMSGWSRPTVRIAIEQSWYVLALLGLFAVLLRTALYPNAGRRNDRTTADQAQDP